jgi:hypothetical protein
VYEGDLPNLRKLRLADLTHACGAATAGRGTRRPRSQLDRWVFLRDLLVDAWQNPTDPEEEVLHRHLQAQSALERDLIRRMFFNVRRIVSFPEGAEVDLEGHSRHFDHAGVTTAVGVTWSFALPDGSAEHYRLKTGRSRTTPEEAAVLWAGAEEGEGFFDVMAWPGEVEEIAPPPTLEERLRTVIETSPALGKPSTRPGYYCSWCDRSALCGAYPPTEERTVPNTARIINLTKTDLVDLAVCQRRVAWRRVHAIPYDDGDDPLVGDQLSSGREFHGLLGSVHGADHPEEALENALRTLPASEVAEMRLLWDHHSALLAEEGLTVRRSEFPVGATFLDGPNHDLSGATLIGFLDLTARDRDGHPVAVEVKTGAYQPAELENDLYAVGMSRWVEADPLVIHRHFIRADPPFCERVEYSPEDLVKARDRLRHRLQPALDWDWTEPLQPPYQVGAWCQGCRHQGTCALYRA